MGASPSPSLTDRQRALVLQRSSLNLARRLARRFAPGGEPFNDYLLAGLTGLCRAALAYDPGRCPDRDPPFRIFARVFVLREMEALVQQEQLASRHAQGYVARLHREGLDPSDPAITEGDVEQARRLGMRPDTVSRQRRQLAEGQARPVALEGLAAVPLDGTAPSAEEEALARIARDEVRAAVDALPCRVAMVVRMLWWDGLTRPEIARRCRVTERTVTNWLSVGYGLLRESLAHLGDAIPVEGDSEELP